MVTHLWLTHPAVVFVGSLISVVSWCWPWFLSIVVWFVMTSTCCLIYTTTIYTNDITCGWLCWNLAHVCSMGSGYASIAENILMTVFPEVILFSAGCAIYLWPRWPNLVAGIRFWMTPSVWAFYRSSFGVFCFCVCLFLSGIKGIYSIYLTSIVGWVWDILMHFFCWFWCQCRSWISMLWCNPTNQWYWALVIFIKTHTFIFLHVLCSWIWIGVTSLHSILWFKYIFVLIFVCKG